MEKRLTRIMSGQFGLVHPMPCKCLAFFYYCFLDAALDHFHTISLFLPTLDVNDGFSPMVLEDTAFASICLWCMQQNIQLDDLFTTTIKHP